MKRYVIKKTRAKSYFQAGEYGYRTQKTVIFQYIALLNRRDSSTEIWNLKISSYYILKLAVSSVFLSKMCFILNLLLEIDGKKLDHQHRNTQK